MILHTFRAFQLKFLLLGLINHVGFRSFEAKGTKTYCLAYTQNWLEQQGCNPGHPPKI